MLAAVYIPPNSNNNRSEALNELYQHISEQQTAHPDAFLILAGDFNHADLKSVFPKIHQHADFPTWENNTLDFVYTTQRGAYKALPLPHLGASDHITVMLIPAYRLIVNPLQSKVILGPLRCFDMPWYLCLFQLLKTYYWQTCIFFVFSTNSATIICDQDGCTCLHFLEKKI